MQNSSQVHQNRASKKKALLARWHHQIFRQKFNMKFALFIPQLAQTVVDAGAIAHLAQMILNGDCKLKVK